ncbi:MAG: hypothetical protein ACO3JL_21790, partial [Myxococcota bacterium]
SASPGERLRITWSNGLSRAGCIAQVSGDFSLAAFHYVGVDDLLGIHAVCAPFYANRTGGIGETRQKLPAFNLSPSVKTSSESRAIAAILRKKSAGKHLAQVSPFDDRTTPIRPIIAAHFTSEKTRGMLTQYFYAPAMRSEQ